MSKKKGFLLAAVITALVGTAMSFVGCGLDKTTENNNTYGDTRGTMEHTGYIVLDENGETTLHHGTHTTEITNYYDRGGVSSAVPILKFKCGEYVATSQFVAYGDKKPAETKYDHVCHDCFPDAEIGE